MIHDHACRGVPSLIAAVHLHDDGIPSSAAGPLCFLDLRPMLLQLMWCPIINGVLALDSLRVRFFARCPVGFALFRLDPVHGPQIVREDISVRHGEVTLTFLPDVLFREEETGPFDGPAPPGPSGRAPEEAEADSASRETPDSLTISTAGSASLSNGVDAGTGGGRRGHAASTLIPLARELCLHAPRMRLLGLFGMQPIHWAPFCSPLSSLATLGAPAASCVHSGPPNSHPGVFLCRLSADRIR